MKALQRKVWRELWHMRSQALAIAMVLAAGVAMLVMSQATLHSLQTTRDRLYRDYRFSDLWVHVKRAPLAQAERIAQVTGVDAVEARLFAGAKVELPDFADPIEAVVQSVPDPGQAELNRLHLRGGRMLTPFGHDEVLISEAFAQAHRLRPGQRLRATVHGRTQWFVIAGIAISPEYIYQIKPGAMFPDYERFAVLWMNRLALEAALDMDGAFNQLVIRLAPGTRAEAVIERIDRMLEVYGGRGAYDRMNQLSYRFLHEEFKQLATMTRVFPTIFLAVAAFLLNVVFTRLAQTQRDQIAILKAFGYSTGSVALHYAWIVLLICLLGSVLGLALGAWLGHELAGVYQRYFRFPFLDFRLSPAVALSGVGVSLLAALVGTARAVFGAAHEPIAQAMQAPPPQRYRPALVERLGLARRLSPQSRIILRQLERGPVKAFLSLLGLAFAGAILMMARFQDSAINFMVDLQFRLSQQHDLVATFIDLTPRRAIHELRALPGVNQVEGFRSVPVRLRHHNRSFQTTLNGLLPDGQLRRPIDHRLRRITLPADGLVINEYLAKHLGVGVGEWLWVDVLEGHQKKLMLPVTRLVHEYVGLQAYMNLEALNRALGDGQVINGVLMTVDDGAEPAVFKALDRRPGVVSAESRLAAVRAVGKSIGEMTGVFTWIAVVMGAIINFGVVYNSARIAWAERARELASLRVLGLTQGEVSYILLGELVLLVLLSIPLSFAVGYGLSWYMAYELQSDLYRVPVQIPASACAFTALTTLVSACLSVAALRWRIARLDLIAVLKTRE